MNVSADQLAHHPLETRALNADSPTLYGTQEADRASGDMPATGLIPKVGKGRKFAQRMLEKAQTEGRDLGLIGQALRTVAIAEETSPSSGKFGSIQPENAALHRVAVTQSLPPVAVETLEELERKQRKSRAQRQALSSTYARELWTAPADQPAPQFPSQDVPQVARLVPSSRPLSRQDFEQAPSVVRFSLTREHALRTLTADLDAAPCPATARRIFQALICVAINVARALGYASTVTRAVFHLPAELVMAHVGRGKSAFYENISHLRRLGLVDAEAHMGDLRGEKVATGTLWAVTLQPGRILNGHAAPVRLRREDWSHEWRNLNRDVKEGRTVYRLLRGQPESGRHDPDSQEPPEAGKACHSHGKKPVRHVDEATLAAWAIKSAASQVVSDTLTVRPALTDEVDLVWELGTAAAVPRCDRANIVDRQARALAVVFGDGEKALGFWRKLIWNLLRGIDAGCDLTQDVGVVLMSVLTDVRSDQLANDNTLKNPAAKANAALSRAGLLDQLRGWEYRTVGSRPAA